MDAIRCQELTSRARRRGRPVVDRLDLVVGHGEVVGLVGPGDAGKTMLLRLLTGLARARSGSAWLLGARVPCPERLVEVGAMIGRPGFHPWLTGRAQLELLLRAGPSAPRASVDETLRLTRLWHIADQRIRTWPTPARRRLALAAALLRRPRLLLLDEPVAGLDADGTAEVAALLGDLAAEGVTMLVAARRLGILEPLCRRVLVMERGRLVTDRPAASVRIRLDPADHQTAVHLLAGYGLRVEAPGVLLVGEADGYRVNQALAGAGVYAQAIEAAIPAVDTPPAVTASRGHRASARR